jgi:hypothetical protein
VKLPSSQYNLFVLRSHSTEYNADSGESSDLQSIAITGVTLQVHSQWINIRGDNTIRINNPTDVRDITRSKIHSS